MKGNKGLIPFLLVGCLVVLFIPAAAFAEELPEYFQMISTGSGLTFHKEMFMLPATYSNEYTDAQTEAVFQLSAKHRLFRTRFYFGYTQISFWQAYDHHNSAPFRETNYNPEIFYRTQRLPFSNGEVGADIGFEHESNGQKPPISRSWNLLYFSPYYYNSDFLVYLKVRYRIPEDDKESPLDAVGDDNPDITDYLGYTDLHFFHKFLKNQTIHVMLRGNLDTGRGWISLMYSLPVPNSTSTYMCFKVSHGYGESLVDYNRELTRVGVGITFNR